MKIKQYEERASDFKFSLIDPTTIGTNITYRRLLDGFKMVCFLSGYDSGGKMLWRGCRDRGNGLISAEAGRLILPGLCRDTEQDLHKFLDSVDRAFTLDKSKKTIPTLPNYKLSPSGIILNKSTCWQERMFGVVFSNQNTGDEWKFGGKMTDVRKELKISYVEMENILFSGRMVRGWYISRIDPDWNGVFDKGGTTVSSGLPVRILQNITGISRQRLDSIRSGKLSMWDGWAYRAG